MQRPTSVANFHDQTYFCKRTEVAGARLCCSKNTSSFPFSSCAYTISARRKPQATPQQEAKRAVQSSIRTVYGKSPQSPVLGINNGHAAGPGSQVEAIDVCPHSGWHSYARRESPHLRLHGETLVIAL